MIKVVLMTIVLYLVGQYLLPRDWTRIRDIWIHGALYSTIPCLLFASDIFTPLRKNEIFTAISIGLLISLIWSYLIYRYEKNLLPEYFFKKIKLPQIIIWVAVFISLKAFNMNDSVIFLAIVIYTVISLVGTLLLEWNLRKEIHIQL